jgi:hypothetical protein
MRLPIALAILCATTTAFADEYSNLSHSISGAWGALADGSYALVGDGRVDPPRCEIILAELTEAGATDATTFTFLRASRDLTAGTHTIGEARAACAQIAYWSKVRAFRTEALQSSQYGNLEMAKRCIDTYAVITKAGVPATEVVANETVSINGKVQEFGGTIEAIRVKHCDGAYQKYADEQAQREAPYRKVLKADKLEAALSGRFWMLPGGVEGANDPKKLAAAKVWFYTLTPADGSSRCLGREITLHRWQFDAKHKLRKTTQKTFCGDPPRSAYR